MILRSLAGLRGCAAASLFCVSWLLSGPASADLLERYEVRPERSFQFPLLDPEQPARQGPTVFDFLADGRLVAIATLDSDPGVPFGDGTPLVLIETAPGSRVFSSRGQLPLAPSAGWKDYGPSFVRVSPGGGRLAVSDNQGRIGIFDTAELEDLSTAAPRWYRQDHFAGAWLDENQLALSFGFAPAGVGILDVTSPLEAPQFDPVVGGIAGAAADVALDADGNLYTGNGYSSDFVGTRTGQVKRFAAADWEAARTNGPLDFESAPLLTQYSSAGTLLADMEGNLVIAGGRSDAPLAASNGLAIFRPADGALREFDPNDVNNASGNFYVAVRNRLSGEIFVNEPFQLDTQNGNSDIRRVHVISPHVPEPSSLLLALAGLACLPLARRFLGRRPARISAGCRGEVSGTAACRIPRW